MDNLVLEYRDPLFGVIMIFALIFLISFFTYSYGIYKEKLSRKEYRKLHKRFEMGKLKEEDYVHLYKTYNLPFDSILLLASSFIHKGDYNKAINVYLSLLEHVKDRVKKEELLELLGLTYFKSGFLQRSKEIFLRILKFSPRNKNALQYLVIINEKLKDLNKSKEILSCLDELNIDTKKERLYLDALIIINDPIISFEKKSYQLFKLYKEDNSIERILTTFLLQYDKKFFWDNIEFFDCKKITDLMWYLDKSDIDFQKVTKNEFLVELYNAKGYLDTKKHSDNFDLDILILLNEHRKNHNAMLNFEFVCTNCKHTHPIFETRCNHCHSILTYDINYYLSKGYTFEKNQSLQ